MGCYFPNFYFIIILVFLFEILKYYFKNVGIVCEKNSRVQLRKRNGKRKLLGMFWISVEGDWMLIFFVISRRE